MNHDLLMCRWIPETVLWTAMAIFAFAWACLVFLTTYVATRHLPDDTRTSVSFATAGVCLVLIFFVLGFIASVLLVRCVPDTERISRVLGSAGLDVWLGEGWKDFPGRLRAV